MSKKILLAISSLSGGGAERVVSVWSKELAARGYDVSILVFSRVENEYFVPESVRIYSVAPTNGEYLAIPYPKRLTKMRALVKGIAPDCIISFLPTTQIWMMFATLGLGVKRVETLRNNPYRIGLQSPLSKFFWKMCYHSCDSIIIQATDQEPFFSVRDRKKCVLIPNPISPLYVEHYKEDTAEQACGFIAAGRLAEQKNYPMMIRAFARAAKEHPGITLKIFGKGSDKHTDMLRQLISSENMENNIFLMGKTDRMEDEYKKADAFLLSSDYEGLPNVLMEAMASRLVCVSTDCKTGPADLIDDGKNGFLVPVGDTDAMAQTISRIMAMPKQERANMADAARAKILNYCSQENSVEKLCGLLKSL